VAHKVIRDSKDRSGVEDCAGIETSAQEPGDWVDVASKTLKADETTGEDELAFGQGSLRLEKH